MIPGGMNPKQMQALMRQMGIKSEDIAASKVTIETSSGSIVITNPQVVQVTMQGQKSYQISGEVRVEDKAASGDIALVMEKTGCSEAAAKEALEKCGGDIAEAILHISEAKE